MRTVLFVIVFFIAGRTACAQDTSAVTDLSQVEFALEQTETVQRLVAPDQVATTRSYQQRELVVRKFDDNKWKEIVGDVDYTEKPRKEDKKEASPVRFSMPWGGSVLRFISYAVIAAVIGALVYFVLKNISFSLKIRRTELKSADLEQPVDHIEEIDINALLERARREGDLKLVVRLYYLELLKQLNQRGVIQWKKDKTNKDYLSELFSSNFFFEDIRRLTLSYEAVWYGDHDLRPESYHNLTERFEQLYREINEGAR